ncbi:MAG: FKBP-type peptidyl-prolyl cis-trans isomerase [Novosphingobium sp.]
MTEITRVPLQPIAKGSLAKLWLGVLAAMLAAGGIAWAAMPVQVKVETLIKGSGESPTIDDIALIGYKGTLPDGKVFDQQEQAAMPLQGVIPGFTKALLQMQRGGKYRIFIPAELGYGDKEAGQIPPNTDLTFEVDLIDFKSRAEIEEQQRMMQQLQQMQAQQQGQGGQGGPPRGGAPGGPGAPTP